MRIPVADEHLKRALERIGDAQKTNSGAELIGYAELARDDLAKAIKEAKVSSNSPGGKRTEDNVTPDLFEGDESE